MKKLVAGIVLGIVLALSLSAGATPTAVDSNAVLTQRLDALCVVEQTRDSGGFVEDLHLRAALRTACPDGPNLP